MSKVKNTGMQPSVDIIVSGQSRAAVKSIRFTANCEVRDHNNVIVASYSSGKTYSLRESSCEHWVKRGKAEYVAQDEAEAPKTTTLPKKVDIAYKTIGEKA